MNGIQKVIKYCALAFAVFLSVTIIGSILMFIFGLTSHLSGSVFSLDSSERTTISKSYLPDDIKENDITSVRISCSAKIKVYPGDTLSILAENVPDDYEINVNDGVFQLKEKNDSFFFFLFTGWFFSSDDMPVVTVTVPRDFCAKQFIVDSGSGKVTIDSIEAEKLSLDGGSGRITVTDVKSDVLSVSSGSGIIELVDSSATKSTLDAGSGGIKVKNSKLGRLSLESGSGGVDFIDAVAEDCVLKSGSGSVNYDGTITGKCRVDSGSGSIVMKLTGSASDYKISIDTGSGDLRLNGERKGDGTYGKNIAGSIDFETGSGSVKVDFDQD